MAQRTGSCLCGATKFTAEVPKLDVGACHCSMCQKASGGVFFAVGYEGALKIEDDSALSFYQSSAWGERGFCSKCGSTLFWRTQDHSHGVLSVQSLDDATGATLNGEIFYDNKPDFYSFEQTTHKMTEAEVIAAFAPKNASTEELN